MYARSVTPHLRGPQVRRRRPPIHNWYSWRRSSLPAWLSLMAPWSMSGCPQSGAALRPTLRDHSGLSTRFYSL